MTTWSRVHDSLLYSHPRACLKPLSKLIDIGDYVIIFEYNPIYLVMTCVHSCQKLKS